MKRALDALALRLTQGLRLKALDRGFIATMRERSDLMQEVERLGFKLDGETHSRECAVRVLQRHGLNREFLQELVA